MATIPPLAGLATYVQAAQPGFSVEENVRRLLRLAWFEKRLMEAGLYWLAPTPEWEVKGALGLHLSLDAEHAGVFRKRISEMRSPAPRMDVSPDPAMDCFFDELLEASGTLEKLVGLYAVARQALLDACRAHYHASNPVIDYPTRHMLKHVMVDQEEMLAWGQSAITAQAETPADQARAAEWTTHLRAYLQAAGGLSGTAEKPVLLPPPRASGAFQPDFFPQRDERFAMRWNFSNPQRQVSLNESLPLDERTLALMCRRVIEMDVPEYMTRIIAQSQETSWDYYLALTRQLWDEVRHAMLGEIYFEQRGLDWKKHIAIHPGMAIRLGQLEIKDAHLVLFAIEQNLMPGTTGKKLEYEISVNAQDALAAHIQDYDWADEVLHVQIGRQWLLPRLGISSKEAVEEGWQLRASTLAVLKPYESRGEQKNWWPEFVLIALDRPTAQKEFEGTRM